jgi:uncharacterized protein with HXXEE motif
MTPSGAQSPRIGIPFSVRHSVAWVLLCLALAVHIVDEALSGFLSAYNPAIMAIHERLPWLPLPTFTFEAWLGSLIVAVIISSSLTVLVLRGMRLMISISFVFGVLMLCNGLVHLVASLEMERPMPGLYSAPLLLAASAYLLVTVNQLRRSKQS